MRNMQRAESQSEEDQRLPNVLLAYAKEVEQRELVDCDFGQVLRRAAEIVRDAVSSMSTTEA